MFLKQLYIRHFRNLCEQCVQFASCRNEIIGENAQGKTSLLEAIYVAITGTSFRTPRLRELVSQKEAAFFIEATVARGGLETRVAVTFDGKNRALSINSMPRPPRELLGLVPGVACTPEDMELATGPPSVRRRFLDLHIAQADPLYLHHLVRFRRALAQRNTLLSKQASPSSFSCWEQELARSGAYLSCARQETIGRIGTFAKEMFSTLYQKDSSLGFSLRTLIPPGTDLESARELFEQELVKKRPQEMALGATLVGAHREDLDILIDGCVARSFSSSGQKRVIATAMKLAEWHALQEKTGIKPLLLIDDGMAFLDTTRAGALYDTLSGMGQLFITHHVLQSGEYQEGRQVLSLRQGAVSTASS